MPKIITVINAVLTVLFAASIVWLLWNNYETSKLNQKYYELYEEEQALLDDLGGINALRHKLNEDHLQLLERMKDAIEHVESWIERRAGIFEVSAYTAGPESTGKTPDHPEYGITASGEVVREEHTLACPPSLDFGTQVYIPHFDNTFTCEDRGSAITDGKLDVYIPDLSEALKFGRRELDVVILSKGE